MTSPTTPIPENPSPEDAEISSSPEESLASVPDDSAEQKASAEEELFLPFFLRWAVGLVVAWLIGTTFLLEAFIVPSGSMAYTLWGLHYQFPCEDDGFPVVAGTEVQPREQLAICPNCGKRHLNVHEKSPLIQGDRLVVAKQTYRFRDPRRWEVIIFRRRGSASVMYVKRVIGLPGERVYLFNGDVYIDGDLLRKTLPQQRAMAILVHDQNYQSSETPPRWISHTTDSQWDLERSSFHYPIAENATSPSDSETSEENTTDSNFPVGTSEGFDWAIYRNWERTSGEYPIVDTVRYNLTVPRAFNQYRRVNDLLFKTEMKLEGSGTFAVEITDGRELFQLQITPSERSVKLLKGDEEVASGNIPPAIDFEQVKLEVSLMDRQFLVALDEELILEPYRFAAKTPTAERITRPIAIGAKDIRVELSQIQLWRDIYYTDPSTDQFHRRNGRPIAGISEPYQLESDEFYVLGDNSSNSEDSRFWQEGPGVSRNLLVGKPLFVHWPSQKWEIFGRVFQVPDFSRIRYIE
ncbi:Hypothetical protein PBC10988_31520 [Planctomycetales bacterium 10988]|nr:Hypothetical protein PBC10988_31520 [Planctomycetales bacterium 10988]